MKVVINTCYGGFGLSAKGVKRYLELKGQNVWFYKQTEYAYEDGENVYSRIDVDDIEGLFGYASLIDEGKKINHFPQKTFDKYDIERNDPILVQVVEEMGKESYGDCARLAIVDIEPGVWYKITEYDGYESIEYRDYDNEWSLAK